MKKDNYVEMRNRMRTHFLSYDQNEMIRRFSLESGEEYLYIRFCARDYRIGRHTGIAEWSEDGFQTCFEGDYNESMTIYDVLCCSKPDCRVSGEFCPASSLKGTVYTAANPGSDMIKDTFTLYLNDNLPLLEKACTALGGVPEGQGDIAFRIPMFDFLPMRFAFWEADEDFPPEVRMLWDKNILSFMHYETIWFAAGHLLSRIRELMQQAQNHAERNEDHE